MHDVRHSLSKNSINIICDFGFIGSSQ